MEKAMKKAFLVSMLVLGFAASCAARQNEAPTEVAKSEPQQDQPVLAQDPSQSDQTLATDGEDNAEWGIVGGPSYANVVDKVVGMVQDERVVSGAQRRGLHVVNVMWEDTGRAQGSALGPNITDLTLQVRFSRAAERGEETALMPVIRFPNFTDRTGDVPAEKFFVRVGNERDPKKIRTVPLTDVLRDIRRFVSKPASIRGTGNLLAKRDSHMLVSAQAVFLPIPKTGKAEFNPVVFNYQSAPGSPAVLTLLVTRQGTSATVVENRGEEASSSGWGQELYFNHSGQRAAFTAERKSDVQQRIARQGGPKDQDDQTALQQGADVLLLVQVPLRHAQRGRLGGLQAEAAPAPSVAAPAGAAPAPAKAASAAERSDVEQAVLGHGRKRGPFSEGRGLMLERDPNFPIRVTVQFYKATSNGVVDEADLDAIAKSIGSIYEHADFVGSLVLPEGDANRPTAWQTAGRRWFPW
jgi:hypothetical protein